MITHNIEIAKIADRIIKIEDGKIIKDEGANDASFNQNNN